jgi:nucleotide-binding universal stress UspA family protein
MFKILVGTDGSEPAKLAVEWALNMAVEKGAELILLAVIPPLPTLVSEDLSLEYYPRLDEDMEKYYGKMLKESLDAIQKTNPEIKLSHVLKRGQPGQEIVEAAKETNADLIIVGNRGTGGILTWMLGSTSRHVVEACTVPVVVVKDQKYCEVK